MSSQKKTQTGGKNSQKKNPDSRNKDKKAPPKKGGNSSFSDRVKLSNEELQVVRQSRRAQLAEMSDEDLRERFKNANGTEAEENATRESIIERIIDLGLDPHPEVLDNEEEDEDDRFGNNNDEVEIPKSIRRDPKWREQVIVKQTPAKWMEGKMRPLDEQSIIQTYDPNVFKDMLDKKYFEESNIIVEILNEGGAPTEE